MNVIDFSKAKQERTPHASGECVCLDCKHEWVGVAPVGEVWLECPACHLVRGRFLNPVVRNEAQRWTCLCGNDLFYITRECTYCPNCGEIQAGFV